ncbi:MAG: hypothetical protein EOP62_24035, partial [Sphingomonadales bacterium]
MLRSLWVFWDFNKEAVVGLSLGLVLICVLFVVMTGFGRVEPVTGRITDFTIAGRRGIEPVVIVAVEGRTVHMPGRQGGGCAIGDDVALTRQRGLMGWKYRVAMVPDVCRRPA